MAQSSTLFIRMDVHKATITVAYVAQDHGAAVTSYGQNIRTHLPTGSYASIIACASACLPLSSDPYSA